MSEDVRLYHGDCLDLLPTLAAGSADAIIADPPYGARRPSAWRSDGQRFREVVGNEAVFAEWLRPAFAVLRQGGALYLFTCWDRLGEWKLAAEAVGFKVRSCIVWDKMIHGLADLETCWAPQHEFVLFAAKGRHVLAGRRPKDVLRIQRIDPARLLHPYEKPAALAAALIAASTDEGGVVLDPYMGSGSVGVACLQTGRRYIGCEIDPAYFAVAEKRLAEASSGGPLFERPAQAALPFADVSK